MSQIKLKYDQVRAENRKYLVFLPIMSLIRVIKAHNEKNIRKRNLAHGCSPAVVREYLTRVQSDLFNLDPLVP